MISRRRCWKRFLIAHIPIGERALKQAKTAAQVTNAQGTGSARMTKADAYDILGLEAGASEQDIIAAHRRLMKQFHPDQGGSDYLAARINQAKDLLLGK